MFVGNLVWRGWPVFMHQTGTLVTSSQWGSDYGQFGAWPQILGTLQSSIGAVIIAVVVGLAASLAGVLG